MQFEIGKDELAAELALCDSIVQQRTTMPILSTILIVATKSGITATATDAETTIRSEIDAKVTAEGAFCFPSKRLADYVRSLPVGVVSVSVNKFWATITCGRCTSKMPLLEADEFYNMPIATSRITTLQCSELTTTLQGVLFSVSHEEGVSGSKDLCIDANEKLTFVSMDHSRMPIASVSAECIKECRILLGKKSADSVMRVAAASAGTVEIYGDDRCTTFTMGNRSVTAQRVSRGFPNYKAAINKTYANAMKVKASDLRQSIERAVLFIDPKLPSIVLDLGDAEHGVCVSSKESNDGSGKDTIPYISNSGEPTTLNMNPFFVLDFLRYAKDRDVDFLFNDRKGACEFRLSGIDSYRYLCMPKEW